MPRVTVLMSVFNTKAYVRAAIHSILGQTFTDFELIVVDDGSTDGSWDAIVELAAKDPRVTARRRTVCGGASSALNDGLALARGEFITRQDSDDVSLPARLAEQVSFLDRTPAVGLVAATATVIDAEGKPLGEFRVPAQDAEIQAALLDYMCFCGPVVMVRRPLFEQVGFSFDESLSGSEDYDLCLRMAEVTTLATIQTPLYLYRQHAASVSFQQRHRQLFRKARALEMAILRRGDAGTPRRFANVARDYVKAAVLAHAAKDADGSRDCVARAIALDPAIVHDVPLFDGIVRTCTPPMREADAAAFTSALFEHVFPRTWKLGRLRRRLVADLHIREALLPANRGHWQKIGQHLWPGLRSNPGWLTNKGVRALMVRQTLAWLSGSPQAAGPRSAPGSGDRR